MSKQAKFLKDLDGFTGMAKAYELSEPLGGFTHVVVSAATVMHTGPETYIFGADPGTLKVADWCELEGSYRGGLDHEEALRSAGYEVE